LDATIANYEGQLKILRDQYADLDREKSALELQIIEMREQYANHVQRLPELTREIETERQEKEKIKQNEEIL